MFKGRPIFATLEQLTALVSGMVGSLELAGGQVGQRIVSRAKRTGVPLSPLLPSDLQDHAQLAIHRLTEGSQIRRGYSGYALRRSHPVGVLLRVHSVEIAVSILFSARINPWGAAKIRI